jgi:hypothetical protein
MGLLKSVILITNGIYDLICGSNLIFGFSDKLKHLHTDLFDNPNEELISFMLIIFGLMRLSLNSVYAFISYILEAIILYHYGKKFNIKVIATIAFSLILAFFTII